MKYHFCIAGGGGAAFINDTLNNGGASKWLNGADFLYSTEQIDRAIGGKWDKYVSYRTSMQLASAAYQSITTVSNIGVEVGVGITSSMYVKGQRKDRVNQSFITFATDEAQLSVQYTHKSLFRNRRKEDERFATKLKQLVDIFDDWVLLSGLHTYRDILDLGFTVLYQSRWRLSSYAIASSRPRIVYSGSFNPFHAGHEYIVAALQSYYPSVNVEVPIKSFGKPTLLEGEVQHRVDQITQQTGLNIADVYVSKRSNFVDKVIYEYGSNTIFAVGSDTFARISSNDIETLRLFDVSFIVIERPGYEHEPWTYEQLKVIDSRSFDSVWDNVPQISSTEIRNAN